MAHMIWLIWNRVESGICQSGRCFRKKLRGHQPLWSDIGHFGLKSGRWNNDCCSSIIGHFRLNGTVCIPHIIWVWWENPSQDDDGDCFLNRIEVINISRFNGTPITRNKTSKTTTTILVTGIFAASNVSNVSKSSKSESRIHEPEPTGPGPRVSVPDRTRDCGPWIPCLNYLKSLHQRINLKSLMMTNQMLFLLQFLLCKFCRYSRKCIFHDSFFSLNRTG